MVVDYFIERLELAALPGGVVRARTPHEAFMISRVDGKRASRYNSNSAAALVHRVAPRSRSRGVRYRIARSPCEGEESLSFLLSAREEISVSRKDFQG